MPGARSNIGCGLLFTALLLGCQPDSNKLVLVYPDQAAFDRARMVELYIEEQTTCAKLNSTEKEPLAAFEPNETSVELGTHPPGLLASAPDTAPPDAGCVSDAACQPCYACVAGGCQPTSELRWRRALTIDNPGMFPAITDTSVHFPVDTAALVQAGQLRSDGNDLRLFYAGGGSPVELDRVAESPFDASDTDIWFALVATIAGQATDQDYFVSYGDPAAVSAPADRNNVYLFFDDFEGDLSSWTSDAVFQLSTQQAHSGTQSLRVNSVSEDPHAVWVPGLDEGNIAVEVMFRSSTATIDVSLATRVQASGDSYQFNIEETDQWTIGRVLDGVWESLVSTNASRPADTWYRLTAIQGGPWLSGWVDRVQRVPASGSTFVGTDLPSGSVGLATYDVAVGEHGWFDDFKVWRWVFPEPVITLGEETEWCP